MANQNMMTMCVGDNDDNNGEHDFANPRRRHIEKARFCQEEK